MKTPCLGALLLALAAAGCGSPPARPATYVRYTPQGQVVVFAGDSIDVYTPDLGELETTIATPSPSGQWPYSHAFTLSDDGKVAAVVHPNLDHNYAEIYELATQQKTVVDLGPPYENLIGDQPDDIALSPGGDRLFVIGGLHSIPAVSAMYDTASGQNLWTGDWAITPVYSPDGSTMYAIGKYGTDLQGFDTQTGALTLDVPTASALGRLSTTGNPSLVVGLTSSPQASPCSPTDLCAPQITFYSAGDGSVANQFQLTADTEPLGISPLGLPPFRCSASVGLCTLTVRYYPPSGEPMQSLVQVWNTSGTLMQSLDVTAIDADISPDGQSVVVITGDQNDVAVYRLGDGSLVRSRHYGGNPL